MSSTSSRSGARPPKVGFKKSRNGCQKCKTRRVKCDENKPICRQCSRLKLQCVWPGPRNEPADPVPPRSLAPAAPLSEAAPSEQPAAGENPAVVSQARQFSSILNQQLGNNRGQETAFAGFIGRPEFDYDELPESAGRRLLEHRLMLNWFYRVVNPFPVSPGPEWSNLWSKLMPTMALTNKNLLYGLLSLSASNLLKDAPDDAALFAARQNYLILAMREQREMVAELTVDKADAICFTSMLLLVNAFAMLQERTLEPYSPPMDWISMGRGAGALIWVSIEAIVKSGDASKSSLLVIANSYPYFGEDRSYWEPEMRQRFSGILNQTLPSDDVWDDDTREGYEKTLSYVGSIQKAIEAGEPLYIICRRVQVFSLVLSDKFVEMLGEQRPRALVIIAHFFATVAQLDGLWWLGKARGNVETTARREIEAIKRVIPPEWNGHMIWPMDMVRMVQLPVRG